MLVQGIECLLHNSWSNNNGTFRDDLAMDGPLPFLCVCMNCCAVYELLCRPPRRHPIPLRPASTLTCASSSQKNVTPSNGMVLANQYIVIIPPCATCRSVATDTAVLEKFVRRERTSMHPQPSEQTRGSSTCTMLNLNQCKNSFFRLCLSRALLPPAVAGLQLNASWTSS